MMYQREHKDTYKLKALSPLFPNICLHIIYILKEITHISKY